MKKIILWFFLFFSFVWVSQAQININNQSFTFWNDDEITINIWNTNTVTIIAPYATNNFTIPDATDIVSGICWYRDETWNKWYQCMLYWHINWNLRIIIITRREWGPNGVSIFWIQNTSLFNIFQNNNIPSQYWIQHSNNWVYEITPTGISSTNINNFTDTWVSAMWQFISFNNSTWPSLECTTETIPFFWFNNIFPSNIDDVTEIVIEPSENLFAFWTDFASDDYLQVIFNWVTSLQWTGDFMAWSWSLSFNTENSTFFSQDNTVLTLLTNSQDGIRFITLNWNQWNVDIRYRYSNNPNWTTIQNVDIKNHVNSHGSTGYPVAWDIVQIIFKNSFLSYTLNSLEVKAITGTQTNEVEICYNEEEDIYTIQDWTEDPYVYDWNPYTDLVWVPTPSETTFTQDWYTFFDNGFCLNNFIPFPSWGSLSFEIIKPDGSKVFSWNITNTWVLRYWSNTCPKITTNFHNIEGTYYVRALYTFQGITYTPMGENFFTYNITHPEQISDVFPDELFESSSCASDTSAFSWVINFFSCSTSFITWVFSAIPKFLTWIYEFLASFLEIWQVTETKTWGFFFPQAYASNTEILDWLLKWDSQISAALTNSSWYGFIDNILLFLKVSFVFIVFVLILSLYFNHKNNENNN